MGSRRFSNDSFFRGISILRAYRIMKRSHDNAIEYANIIRPIASACAIASLVFALSLPAPAHADIYRYETDSGEVILTSQPRKDLKLIEENALQPELNNKLEKLVQEAQDLKRKYFGPEGELYKKRESLMKPIQDEIYNAVKEISEDKGYQMVIDRASAMSLIFASPKIDISNEVLLKMGYSK